jgi:hypothetical protein
MLKFSPANAKTKALYLCEGVSPFLSGRRKVYSLDLSSGHSCPGAKLCLSKVVERVDAPGRFTVQDGKDCQFRCFSASQEVCYPAVRKLRQNNFRLIRKMGGWRQCCELLAASIPHDCGVLRYHVGGDFFKLTYMQGALELARMRPDVLFYAYTKSLPFLTRLPMHNASMGIFHPNNFLLTASRGGKHDHLIDTLKMREARVVLSEGEAGRLPIDHDDLHAATYGGSFALLIHGTQPAGSDSGKALSKLKGKGSYARQ